MGLAHRIIPTLLCRGRQLVKGERFNSWRSVGVVAQAVRIYQQRNVDELVLLDIDATREGRSPDLKLIEELTRDCFMPLAVGGGVRNLTDIKALLAAGADKVVVGEMAWMSDILPRASDALGCQAIMVTCDVTTRLDAVVGTKCLWAAATARARWAEQQGAGEILLTAVDREGTLQGYDLELIGNVARLLSIPVIAHGGAGTYQHMLEAFHAGADAVAAGAMFQFTEQTPRGAAEYLARYGIEVRQ